MRRPGTTRQRAAEVRTTAAAQACGIFRPGELRAALLPGTKAGRWHPGSVAFLAGFGADVLRIDPPGWDEPVTVPEVVLGKRCARLDMRVASDLLVFEGLLRQADVLVHDGLIGPGAGALMADLITGATPCVDPRPFRMERFSRLKAFA